MSWSGAEANGAVVLRTTLYFMSGFVAEDAQQGEVLDCYGGNLGELRAVFERVILEAAN